MDRMRGRKICPAQPSHTNCAAALVTGLRADCRWPTAPATVSEMCYYGGRHGRLSLLSALCQVGGKSVMHAECAAVSGHGYYAKGPVPDASGRL